MRIVPCDLFLMKKLLKSDIYGFVYNTQIHYLRLESQHLPLPFINSKNTVKREHGSNPPPSQLSLTDCFIRVK